MAKDRAGSEIAGMNKQQLLEVLLEQSKEADALKRENIEMQKELLKVKKLAEGYRSDLDHAYSLLRLTMRLEKIIQKLDPAYEPEHYEPGLLARLQEDEAAKAAEEAGAADAAEERAAETEDAAEDASKETANPEDI